ncbi:hypothetical protein FRC03_004729 [Tulasnella sp. 419]|nr:hypothetical protein FRC03_004729 [Tulasnella sp. 419]
MAAGLWRGKDVRELPHLTRIICIFSFVFLLLFIYIWQKPTFRHTPNLDSSFPPFIDGKCSPEAWSAGKWERKEDPPQVVEPEDVYKASGFLGCASSREIQWHLSNDHPNEMNWRGNVSAYDWVPPSTCGDIPDDREMIVKDLVEQGGWLLIGDSVTEEHFFSLSCTLYPHVLATPDYTGRWDWDRAWPQNLYLNPQSPLVPKLNMPSGFDIEKTPLVTFRR